MNITTADVDNNYQNFITSAKDGTFNTVRHVPGEGYWDSGLNSDRLVASF
jgi:hypothetical protein